MNFSNVTLTKNERMILKFMIQPLYRWSKPNITREVIANKFNFNGSDTDDLIDQLLESGMLEPHQLDRISKKGELQISTLGREYLNYYNEQLRNKILWSFFVPIVVSLVTTLITMNYLNN